MPSPSPKSAIVIAAASITNGGTATGTVDTLGYDFAVIDVCATTSNNITNNFSVLTLSEGDTTSALTAVKTGDTDFTIAAANTSVPAVTAQFRVDLRGRKRYLAITASPVTTQTIWAHAHLFRGDANPVAAAGAGAEALVHA